MYKGLAQAQWLDVNGNMSNIKKRTILLGPFLFARTLSFVPTACACSPTIPCISIISLDFLEGPFSPFPFWPVWPFFWEGSGECEFGNLVQTRWFENGFLLWGVFCFLLAARWTDWTRPLNQTRRFWIDRARAYKKIPVYGEGEKKTGGEALIFGQSVHNVK